MEGRGGVLITCCKDGVKNTFLILYYADLECLQKILYFFNIYKSGCYFVGWKNSCNFAFHFKGKMCP